MRRLGEIRTQIYCGDSGLTMRLMMVCAPLMHRGPVDIHDGHATITCKVCDTEQSINDLLVGNGQVCCGTCRTVFYQD